jgi:hypothetical protein
MPHSTLNVLEEDTLSHISPFDDLKEDFDVLSLEERHSHGEYWSFRDLMKVNGTRRLPSFARNG